MLGASHNTTSESTKTVVIGNWLAIWCVQPDCNKNRMLPYCNQFRSIIVEFSLLIPSQPVANHLQSSIVGYQEAAQAILHTVSCFEDVQIPGTRFPPKGYPDCIGDKGEIGL